MTETTTIDPGHIAHDLNLPASSVQRTIELLDEGNTVPFITRFRKEQTGGLDEEQVRDIQVRIAKVRQLAERKATILKSIEAQGKLLPELAEQIKHANTSKRLEDLYLPFKPKKQTLATVARDRGLEPLAVEIFEADPQADDLPGRAAIFLAASPELKTVEDVLAGVGHLIAERISEYSDLRGRLRKIFQKTGKIVCTKVETPPAAAVAVQEGETRRGGEGEKEVGSGQEAEVASPSGEADAGGQESVTPSTQESVPSAESPSESAATPNDPTEAVPAQIAVPAPTAETDPAALQSPIPNPQSEIPAPSLPLSVVSPSRIANGPRFARHGRIATRRRLPPRRPPLRGAAHAQSPLRWRRC